MKTRKVCEACLGQHLVSYQLSSKIIAGLEENELKVTSKDYSQCLEMLMCQNCSLIQSKYIPSQNEVTKLYSDIADDDYLRDSTPRGTSNFSQVIPIIERFSTGHSTKIIEIGAGSGSLVHQIKMIYPHTTGIEPNKRFCNYAFDHYHLKLDSIGYEKIKPQKRFQVIIALDVIEHVVSPSEFLKKMHSILDENGILIIGTPNISSVTARLLKKKWWHIRPPHIFYFSDKSFHQLSSGNGLKVIMKKNFTWTFSVGYLLDLLQNFIFKKQLFKIKVPIKIRLNTFDSRLYVLTKCEQIDQKIY